MFRIFTLTAASLALTFNSVTLADGNDLFSEFQSRSVFASSADSGGNASGSPTKRITSAEKIRDLIKETGLEARVAGKRVVTTQKELSPWTFPVLLVLSEDETSINIILGLTTIKDVDKELTADKLLKMMTASQKNAPMMFSYNAGRERTELSRMLRNRSLDGQSLRDEINRMAIVARDNSSMWAAESQSNTVDETKEAPAETPTSPQTPTAPQTPTVSREILTGKWSAAKSSTEAFGIEFKADGTFNLVYIKSSNQTKSSGSFTIASEKLTLTGTDGLKLEGTVALKSAGEFSFKPASGDALNFIKAK